MLHFSCTLVELNEHLGVQNTSMAGQNDRLWRKGYVAVCFGVNSVGQSEFTSFVKLVFVCPFQGAHSPRFRVARPI